MGEHVYQLGVYTLSYCAVGAAVCWRSDTWALLFDSARCCGVWLAGSRQGLRVLWVSEAVLLMTYAESTLHYHVTGIVTGESWVGGQGMQKDTECLPVTPFPLQSSSSVQGASIDDKHETKMTMTTPPVWGSPAKQGNIKFLPDRLRSLTVKFH
jgi:hypothetical protein